MGQSHYISGFDKLQLSYPSQMELFCGSFRIHIARTASLYSQQSIQVLYLIAKQPGAPYTSVEMQMYRSPCSLSWRRYWIEVARSSEEARTSDSAFHSKPTFQNQICAPGIARAAVVEIDPICSSSNRNCNPALTPALTKRFPSSNKHERIKVFLSCP